MRGLRTGAGRTPPEHRWSWANAADASTTTSVREVTPPSSTCPRRMSPTRRAGASTTSNSDLDEHTTLPHPTDGRVRRDRQYDLLSHGDKSASVAVMIRANGARRGLRRAHRRHVRPTETVDRFRIASVSKVITAIVTLQLVEDGLLAIDDRWRGVASYLGVTPRRRSRRSPSSNCSATRRALGFTTRRSSREAQRRAPMPRGAGAHGCGVAAATATAT